MIASVSIPFEYSGVGGWVLMRCPTLSELPPPPPGRPGWPFDMAQDEPWTENNPQRLNTVPDPPPGSGKTASWPRVSIVMPSNDLELCLKETG